MDNPSNLLNTNGQARGEAVAVSGFQQGQKILGRYRLERVLGQGGMGVVWLACDEELERDVALKFLPEMVINDRASLNDLKRETRRSLELTHPNIVRTYDFVQDSTIAGISMEYVDSDTLRNLRIDQPHSVFECNQIGEWTRQLCQALDYAHGQAAIVHRDLKPANLMINRRNQLKVTDFGISRSLVESMTQMTQNAGISGTLVYMSPQQLSGETASPLDDVYAIGATLYELLTTRPPFYSGDITGQVHNKTPPTLAVRRRQLEVPIGEIPEQWETTVAACLAKDPGQRPRSAGEIAVRLGLAEASSFSAGETMATGSVDLTPRPGGPPSFRAPGPGTGGNPVVSGFTTHHPQPQPPLSLPRIVEWLQNNRRLAMTGGGVLAALLLLAVLAELWSKPSNTVAKNGAPVVAAAPVRGRGSLMVKTDPPGAMVQVGDHPAVRSPFAFEALPPGPANVQISLPGYETRNFTAQIEEGKLVNTGELKLERSKGSLRVESEPPGMAYELKSRANPLDTSRGVTPLLAAEMPTGDYEIAISRDGWPTQRRSLTVKPREECAAQFNFQAGHVSLTSEPPNAKVLIDGVEFGATPLVLHEIQPGDVRFTVTAPGYESVTVQGAVLPGQTFEPPTVVLQKSAGTVAKTTTAPPPRASSSSSSSNRSSSSTHRDYDDRPSGNGVGHKMKEGLKHAFGF